MGVPPHGVREGEPAEEVAHLPVVVGPHDTVLNNTGPVVRHDHQGENR